MAVPVLVLGRSGSGKTYSLKNFKADEVGILSVEKGRLPFKSDLKVARVKSFSDGEHTPAQANAARYSWIEMAIKTCKLKSVVVDDSQYLLANELFDRCYEKGYDKFIDIAAHFRNLVHAINEMEEEDKIVYFLHHSELDADGREKVKTIGKMLDEKLCIEGTNCILLEMPFAAWTSADIAAVRAIAESGFVPLMAHIDRYAMSDVLKLASLDVPMQVNAEALCKLLRHQNPFSFLKQGCVFAIGSDLHGTDGKAYKNFLKAVQKPAVQIAGVSAKSKKLLKSAITL